MGVWGFYFNTLGLEGGPSKGRLRLGRYGSMRAAFLSLIILILTGTSWAQETCHFSSAHTPFKDVKELLQVQNFSHKDCTEYNELSKLQPEHQAAGMFLNNPEAANEFKKAGERIDAAFIKCSSAQYLSCYPNPKSMDVDVLDQEFESYKKDPLLRLGNPAAHCLPRAQLLSARLAKAGYDVDIVEYTAPTLVGLIRPSKTRYMEYAELGAGVHYVVRIAVKDRTGAKSYRILDPQFADKPLTVKDYSKALTGMACAEDSQALCRMEVRKPTAYPVYWGPSDQSKDLKSPVVDSCGWNDLERSEKELEGISTGLGNSSVATFEVPAEARNLNDAELVEFLQKKNLRGAIENYRQELERNKLLLRNLDSGQISIGMMSGIDLKDPSVDPALKKFIEEQNKTGRENVLQQMTKTESKIKNLEAELNRRKP